MSKEQQYNSTDDTVYGTIFVFCTQHCRVHETGWCTVPVVQKIPLLGLTAADAQTEWDIKKVWLLKEWK